MDDEDVDIVVVLVVACFADDLEIEVDSSNLLVTVFKSTGMEDFIDVLDNFGESSAMLLFSEV